MAKIAIMIDKDFEDSEYSVPFNAFKDAGHEIVHIGIEEGQIVEGKKERTAVTIDLSAKDASVDGFDALMIPGGYSPDHLRAHAAPVAFVKEFASTGKPIFSICHGAQLLISAQALKGRTLTAWKSLEQDVKNAGALFLDKEVVIDENLVTSRNPDDLPAFCKASLKMLAGK
jgi:protease I